MNDIMLDLETMGTGSNAAIVSIGAVMFDKSGLGDEFYRAVDLQSSMDAGLKIDSKAILFWLKQNDAAKTIFTVPSAHSSELRSVLLSFANVFLGDRNRNRVRIWGNGSDFDNVILANAYKAVNLNMPWAYKNSRCYRTLKNMNRDIALTRVGTHHNALDDAKTQALHLIDIANIKGLTLK